MNNIANFDTDRDVLERCAEFLWQIFGYQIVSDHPYGERIVDLSYTRMISKHGIVLLPVDFRISGNVSSLKPVDCCKRLKSGLARSIGGSPFIGKAWDCKKKQQEIFKHFNLRQGYALAAPVTAGLAGRLGFSGIGIIP